MAVAIRGTTPATTAVTSDPMSVSLTGARQPQTDDVLIIVHCNDFYALSNMPTPTVGGSSSGVTTIVDADAGTDSAHIKSWYYVVGSTGDLTVAVDETGAGDEEKGLAVYVLDGVDTATPIDTSGSAINTGGTTHIAPSVSPSSSDAFLICHASVGGGAGPASYTSPGSMTEAYDVAITAFCMVGATEQLSASGATGTRTFTPITSVANNAEISIAVKTSSAAAAVDSSAYSIARLPGRIGPDGKVFTPGRRFDSNGAAAPATNAPAGDAAGTGNALQPTAALGVSAGVAAAAGSASQPSAALGVSTGVAAATGTASQPTTAIQANAGVASATGTAPQSVAAVRVNTGVAEASGSALQATVSTVPATNAPAGLATATGSALQPTIAITVRLAAPAATGTAPQPTVSISGSANAPAGLAAATGTALAPTIAVRALAGVASGTGTASPATVLTGDIGFAGLATAVGIALQPTIAIRAFAGVASAVGTAPQAIGQGDLPVERISDPLTLAAAGPDLTLSTVKLSSALATAGPDLTLLAVDVPLTLEALED